jgi:hypothetical protein
MPACEYAIIIESYREKQSNAAKDKQQQACALSRVHFAPHSTQNHTIDFDLKRLRNQSIVTLDY